MLVDRIKTGQLLIEKNPDWVFISGEMKSADRKDEYKEVSKMDNKVIVATYGVGASTGINIPRIFNLILLEPGKSFVRVIQIGRGIRKAQDKDYLQVFDITQYFEI